MTDWKKYFNSTILSRGRQYYQEDGVQTELELAQQRMDKEDKVIFKKLAAQTEYNYFDLNMAAQKLELSRSIWEKAKRLAEQKQIVLDDIQRGIWDGTVIRSLFCMQRADILQKEMMVMRFRSFALRTVLNRHCVMSEDAEDLIRLPERDIERIVMAMFVSMR